MVDPDRACCPPGDRVEPCRVRHLRGPHGRPEPFRAAAQQAGRMPPPRHPGHEEREDFLPPFLPSSDCAAEDVLGLDLPSLAAVALALRAVALPLPFLSIIAVSGRPAWTLGSAPAPALDWASRVRTPQGRVYRAGRGPHREEARAARGRGPAGSAGPGRGRMQGRTVRWSCRVVPHRRLRMPLQLHLLGVAAGGPMGALGMRKVADHSLTGSSSVLRRNGLVAGPSMTAPSGVKREPWSGQSQEPSAVVPAQDAAEVRAQRHHGTWASVEVRARRWGPGRRDPRPRRRPPHRPADAARRGPDRWPGTRPRRR